MTSKGRRLNYKADKNKASRLVNKKVRKGCSTRPHRAPCGRHKNVILQ